MIVTDDKDANIALIDPKCDSMPLVSIVIVTFNRKHLLPRAVESVRAQTFKDWELIIINNGSTDSTEEVIDSYKKMDSRIRSFSQGDLGITKARAKAISLCTGKYVAFLDDDDAFMPDKLEKQTKYLETNPQIDMVYGLVKMVGEKCPFPSPFPENPETDYLGLLSKNTIQTHATLIRKVTFDRIGNFWTELNGGDDYEMWLRIAFYGHIAFMPSIMGEYHWHVNNMSYNIFRRSYSQSKTYWRYIKLSRNTKWAEATVKRAAFFNYFQASDALDRADYKAALLHFFNAILVNPKIGLIIEWNQTASPVYRFLRPYLGVVKSAIEFLKEWIRGKRIS